MRNAKEIDVQSVGSVRQVDVETALTAMCAWEEVLSRSATEGDIYRVLIDAYGTNHIRHYVLTVLAPAVEEAYATTGVQFDAPFDWEFVPLALKCIEPFLLSRDVHDCKTIPLAEAQSIGKLLLAEYSKDKSTK